MKLTEITDYAIEETEKAFEAAGDSTGAILDAYAFTFGILLGLAKELAERIEKLESK